MEKRNTMLLTVIAIATLLVAVIGATFAYFATTTRIDVSVPVNIDTPANKASFSAIPSKDIAITVDANEMQQSDANAETETNTSVGLTDSADLNVVLKAAAAGETSTCTYDIIWTWTSEKYAIDKATETNPNPEKRHYWATTDVVKEFTIQGTAEAINTETGTTTTALAETNFNSEAFTEAQRTVNGSTLDYITLVNDAKIAVSKIDGGNVNWTFTVRFYNATKDQSALMGKKLTGTISVNPDTISC